MRGFSAFTRDEAVRYQFAQNLELLSGYSGAGGVQRFCCWGLDHLLKLVPCDGAAWYLADASGEIELVFHRASTSALEKSYQAPFEHVGGVARGLGRHLAEAGNQKPCPSRYQFRGGWLDGCCSGASVLTAWPMRRASSISILHFFWGGDKAYRWASDDSYFPVPLAALLTAGLRQHMLRSGLIDDLFPAVRRTGDSWAVASPGGLLLASTQDFDEFLGSEYPGSKGVRLPSSLMSGKKDVCRQGRRQGAFVAVRQIDDLCYLCLLKTPRQRLFTQAERVVAEAIMQELSIKTIAQKRNTSENTVKSQVKSIYAKLGVSNREEFYTVMRGANDNGKSSSP